MRRLVGGWALALCACGPVVDIGPGTDAETSDSDAPTTGMMTATTEPMTTAGPSTTVLDTSASDSVSISTTADPTSATTYDPDPVHGICVPTCETPVDCCAGDPSCPDMLGEYPYNYGCENGACIYGGCESDEDCTFGGVIEGYVCEVIDGYAGCWPSCATDQNCVDQGLSGWVCDPELGVCSLPSCTTDAECTNGTVCRGDPGTCVYPCEQGAEPCSGFGHCDPDTGQCVCDSDDECMDGYGCTPWPN